MKMNLYVVFDRMAQESGPVFEAKNDPVAARQTRALIAQAPGANILEFQLLKLGTIDHETNAIEALGAPLDVTFSVAEEA